MLSYEFNNLCSFKYNYLICCFVFLLFVEVEHINYDIYAATPSVYFNNQQLGMSKHESIYLLFCLNVILV